MDTDGIVKTYAEHGITFQLFKKDCYATVKEKHPFQYCDTIEKALLTIDTDKRTDYFKWQSKYYSGLDYRDYLKFAEINIEKVRRNLYECKNAAQNDLSPDQRYFLIETYLLISCAILFSESWYMRPIINFSTEFYTYFFEVKKELLYNHYQYDNDISNLNHLPLAENMPGNYEYIPAPHLINKKNAQQLLTLMQSAIPAAAAWLQAEAALFKKMLEYIGKDEGVLVIQAYM
jgi:hypothetical protein